MVRSKRESKRVTTRKAVNTLLRTKRRSLESAQQLFKYGTPNVRAVQGPAGWKIIVGFTRHPFNIFELDFPLDKAVVLLGRGLRFSKAGWDSQCRKTLKLYDEGREPKAIAQVLGLPAEIVDEWERDKSLLKNFMNEIREKPESREGSL